MEERMTPYQAAGGEQPEVLAARLEIAEAGKAYAFRLSGYREEMALAMEKCLLLQADIGALPAAAENAGQAKEMERLCGQLNDARLALRNLAREYPRKKARAEAQCRKRIRAQKEKLARLACAQEEQSEREKKNARGWRARKGRA